MDLPKTPSFRLDGKRALVTGGSSGIGLAAAVACAEAGAETVVAARRVDILEDVVAAMNARGLKAEAMVLDVTDVEAVRREVGAAGPFQVLVNSAGLARHSKVLETTVDDFDAVVNVNLRGAYFLNQAVAQGLIDAGLPGSLITISSQMGVIGGRERAVYCATKHGVEGLTKAMAIEFGPHNIRVNSVCPTFVRTALTEATFARPEMVAWVMSKIKLGRVGEVTDLMGPVVYLASDASALVTGTSHLVDGGWTSE